MMNFIKNNFNFKIYGVTWFAIINAILILPCIMFLPERFGYENGLLENIQMFILFLGLCFSFSAKSDKRFFVFVGLVLVILILREVNCGRTLFFQVPGVENAYYSWKEIKYGYLAHPIYGAFIASVAIYFLKNKLFINLWNYIKKTKLPVWNILFMFVGMGLGLFAEHSMHNMVWEEITELLFYTSLVGIIWLYSRNRDFTIA